MSVQVTKADGSREIYKVEKLRRSLRRAGALPDEVNEIVAAVDKTLFDGIKTQVIYRHAFDLLRQSVPPAAARYSLRRALFNLGPTGFPFETFLARLYSAQGYTTKTGTMLEGACATHEIDLVAYKKDHSFIGEAKFHARPGIKSDLQVVMYNYARLLDLKGMRTCDQDVCGITDLTVITNTKFTSTAVQYGKCVGLKLLSWTYPKRGNLHDLIQRERVYPVTVLQQLSGAQIKTLISYDVILCRDLLEREQVLRHLHVPRHKHEAILDEAREVCRFTPDS